MPPAFVHPFGGVLPCISCVAQFNFELPAEIERTICCPSGGAAEGHFVDEEATAACWVDVIVGVVGGAADGVLVGFIQHNLYFIIMVQHSTSNNRQKIFSPKTSRGKVVEVTEASFFS